MLIEVKIQCDCGTRYKFDVEPLDGRLPTRVFCPGCGCDGTEAANAQLRQKLAPPVGKLIKTAPIPKGSVFGPPVLQSESLIVEPASGQSPGVARRIAPTTPPGSQSRFALGTVGALLAASVATLVWFFLIKVTGYQIGFAAWGAGLLIGMAARGFAHEGSPRLGVMAALCALAAIVVGQWLATRARSGIPPSGLSDGSFGLVTLLWLFLAVASAWKLAISREAP